VSPERLLDNFPATLVGAIAFFPLLLPFLVPVPVPLPLPLPFDLVPVSVSPEDPDAPEEPDAPEDPDAPVPVPVPVPFPESVAPDSVLGGYVA